MCSSSAFHQFSKQRYPARSQLLLHCDWLRWLCVYNCTQRTYRLSTCCVGVRGGCGAKRERKTKVWWQRKIGQSGREELKSRRQPLTTDLVLNTNNEKVDHVAVANGKGKCNYNWWRARVGGLLTWIYIHSPSSSPSLFASHLPHSIHFMSLQVQWPSKSVDSVGTCLLTCNYSDSTRTVSWVDSA